MSASPVDKLGIDLESAGVEELAKLRKSLEDWHAELMRDLYREIARHRGIGPFEELTTASKEMLISEATTMCQAWDSDAALRSSHVSGKSRIVDLVAAQYSVAQAIREVEDRMISAIGAQTTRH